MQLMIETGREEIGRHAGEPGHKTGNWNFVIRLGLAVAAVCAAYLIMTSAWPAEIAGKVFANVAVETGSLPGPVGTLLASLR